MKRLLFLFLERITQPLRGTGLKKVPGILALYRSVFARVRPPSVTVNGCTMFLDPLDTLELATRGDAYERFIRSVFQRTIREGDTVLDLGAHIGIFTLAAARRVGQAGKVVAFEASPVNVPILQKNIAVNGFEKVATVVAGAVSDASGKSTLYLFDRYGSGQHSLYEKSAAAAVEVETYSLDDYVARHPVSKIDVMKIDIEGSEWHAWRGMQGVLAANRRMTIFTEFCPRLLTMAGVAPQDYLDAIEAAGFRIAVLDDEHRKITPSTAAHVGQEFTVAKDNLANLMCTRS
jgi:FkbM family methyltransferase